MNVDVNVTVKLDLSSTMVDMLWNVLIRAPIVIDHGASHTSARGRIGPVLRPACRQEGRIRWGQNRRSSASPGG